MRLYNDDCIKAMCNIPDRSIDMILTDPPYGKTACKWDSVIPLDLMWKQLRRIIKPSGAIVMTASQPFTTTLIASNMEMFKYDIVWEKSRISNPLRNKKEPSRVHESIILFCDGVPTYNPQTFFIDEKYIDKRKSLNNSNWGKGQFKGEMIRKKDSGERQPQSVVFFKSHWSKGMHPTQKPVDLMEYLIKTYTNERELILDFAMGSGTSGVGCKNLNRDFIGIEKDKEWFEKAEKRINKSQGQLF